MRARNAAAVAALLWINLYICRDWFTHATAWMNSLHGFYAALARYGVTLMPSWWPFWDCGMPQEFASAPLVPALAGLRHASPLLGYQSVSAIFYCAAPLALFALAWTLTRSTEYSFFAALFFSLLSPAQIIVPEGGFSWAGLFSPHRFKLQAVWDETPHVAALTFLLLFVAFLIRARETPRLVPSLLAAISLALAMLAWPFAIIAAALAALALRAPVWGIFAWALLLSARFLPPSLWYAMGVASAAHDGWNIGVLKYYAALAVLWFTLEHFLQRAKDWRLPFLLLWTFALAAAPVLEMHFERVILPQAHRFRIDLEAAIALLVVIAVARLPRPVRAVIATAALIGAIPLVLAHRREAKDVLFPRDPTRTLEYRIAERIDHDLPGQRVLLPGSIAHWANAFTSVQQFGGGEGTTAYSQTQQRALKSVFDGDPAPLAAYDVAAVAVPAPNSAEFWKPFVHPEVFAAQLPVLWSDEGITVYRVSQPSSATLQWHDRNHVTVHTDTGIIPINYHPGWHTNVPLQADSNGLIRAPAPATLDLTYDGGTELRVCLAVSLLTLVLTLAALVRRPR
jgi:hypothetical protein